ncbi:hypothetical protein V3391_07675 [Luteimonas sp. SMYT11W]|uniref:TnsA endonuclease N-terminal domain-containing protein n=1 Tax=Luteimonas flava TaxID=3115822 RepID=A0ABU7WDP4_9GAMM
MRPIFRYPSWTLQREVQLESLLEHRVAVLLDACPRVLAFAEQPAELRLRHGGEIFRHVPDFAVVVEEGPQFLEVKFSKYVDTALIERTARITAALEPLGVGYRLITEHDMPAKVRETNARLLTMRARLCPAGVATLLLTERAAQLQQPTLEALGWTSAADARVLAAALLEGRLHADFSATLCPASPVSLQSSTEGWLWG